MVIVGEAGGEFGGEEEEKGGYEEMEEEEHVPRTGWVEDEALGCFLVALKRCG